MTRRKKTGTIELLQCESKCRVCLNNSEYSELVSLFEPYRNFTYAYFISSLCGFEIQDDDKTLPIFICKSCVKELEIVQRFKQKCIDSERTLQSVVASAAAEVKETDSIIKQESPSVKNEDSDTDLPSIKYEKLESDFEYESEIESNTEDAPETLPSKVTEPESVECHDCGNVFLSKCKLRVHWKQLHKYEKLTCNLCKKAFKSVKTYKRHTVKPCLPNPECVEIDINGKIRTFSCTKCNYVTKKQFLIKNHIARTHFGLKLFCCDLCGKKYSQQSGLLDHRERIHKIIRASMTCEHCGKFIEGRRQCKYHILTHKEKKLQCDICKALFRTKKCLKIHIWNVHEARNKREKGKKGKQKLYTCEVCGHQSSSTSSYYYHKHVTHSQLIIQNCNLCRFECKNKYTLKRHKVHHRQVSSGYVQCTNCWKFFSSFFLLEQHEKRYHEGKRFQCEICKVLFTTKSHATVHQKNFHPELYKSNGPSIVRTEPK